MIPNGKVIFGEWLPDLPAHENPGLVVASNVYPMDGGYAPYYALSTSSIGEIASEPKGAFIAVADDNTTYLHTGTGTKLYDGSAVVGSAMTDRSGATTFTATTAGDFWSFAQYGTIVIATNFRDVPVYKEIGTTDNFATLATSGTAPKAQVIGVIGQFVVLGDLDEGGTLLPSTIQWSAIDDPNDWPTVGTTGAIAVQSSAEKFPAEYGPVTAIVGGKSVGLVFQERAVHRMTYIGGDVVFQFEKISDKIGCAAPRSPVQVGGVTYFWSMNGIAKTDGVTVVPMGSERVDKTIWRNFSSMGSRWFVTGVYSSIRNCILWSYTTSNSGRPSDVLIYSVGEDRFSTATQFHTLLVQGKDQSLEPFGYSQSPYRFGSFPVSGATSTATIQTGYAELNPGGHVFISGVRPLIEKYSSDTLSSLTVSLAARETTDATQSFGSAVSRTSRTGMCDFRVDGRYVAANVSFAASGSNNLLIKASGIQFDYVPTGGV